MKLAAWIDTIFANIKAFHLSFLALVLALGCMPTEGQTAAEISRWAEAPTTIYHGKSLENVDTGNGNLHISLSRLHDGSSEGWYTVTTFGSALTGGH